MAAPPRFSPSVPRRMRRPVVRAQVGLHLDDPPDALNAICHMHQGLAQQFAAELVRVGRLRCGKRRNRDSDRGCDHQEEQIAEEDQRRKYEESREQ